MRIPLNCRCGITMRVPVDLAGRRIRCKACGATMVVPISARASIPSLGSASALFDVTPEPDAPPDGGLDASGRS